MCVFETDIDSDADWLTMFDEQETVFIDRGYLSQQKATILYYNGEGYFKVNANNEEMDIHVLRLTKN